MYFEHFGLNQAPFQITPDTSLFYDGAERGGVLEALIYTTLSGEGIVKVVGEVGSGKTMLCRMLALRLPENVEIIYTGNPGLSPENVLHAIALELELLVTQSDNKLVVMQHLQNYLLQQYSRNRRVILFIEEAQSMPLATLEEIRLLSNLETGRDKLLQIVLFGQSELDDNLAGVGMRQLRERITHSFYLQPLQTKDISQYLCFRMRSSGYNGTGVFGAKTVKSINRYSGGLIRRINLLADKGLLIAFTENKQTVTPIHIRQAAKENGYQQVDIWSRCLWPVSLTVLLLAIISSSWLWLSQKQPQSEYTVPLQTHTDSLNRRIEQTRSWLSTANPEHFTIQLMSVSIDDAAALEKYLRQYEHELNQNELFIYPTYQQGKYLFGVLYAEFNNREEGYASMRQLPLPLKKNKPFLRTVRNIQKEQFTTWQPPS